MTDADVTARYLALAMERIEATMMGEPNALQEEWYRCPLRDKFPCGNPIGSGCTAEPYQKGHKCPFANLDYYPNCAASYGGIFKSLAIHVALSCEMTPDVDCPTCQWLLWHIYNHICWLQTGLELEKEGKQ